MKKLLLVFLLATTVIAVGQNEKRKMKFDTDFTPEQQAILKTKKMALALDLNDSQQSQILTLNKRWIQERMAKREAHKSLNKEEMTSDQKFEMMNTALDTKIAHQAEFKKILNKEQYETWKKSSRKMHYRSKNKGTQGQRKGQKG
jgi:hypothetical protein